jgi:hypothetical protein
MMTKKKFLSLHFFCTHFANKELFTVDRFNLVEDFFVIFKGYNFEMSVRGVDFGNFCLDSQSLDSLG